jgi:hypothetical protein
MTGARRRDVEDFAPWLIRFSLRMEWVDLSSPLEDPGDGSSAVSTG